MDFTYPIPTLTYSILTLFFVVYLFMFLYIKHDFFNVVFHRLDRRFHTLKQKRIEKLNCKGSTSEKHTMKDLSGVIQSKISPTGNLI